MENNQSFSNNPIDKELYEYKDCAGRGCNSRGINLLNIIYIKKSGWFCNACAEEMRESGLIYYGASNAN